MARKDSPCDGGSVNDCGCGLIHMIYYPCKQHWEAISGEWQKIFRDVIITGQGMTEIPKSRKKFGVCLFEV